MIPAARPDGPEEAERPGTRVPIGPFGIIILAGGHATRLGGADKPGLVVGGQSLLGAVITAGTEAGAARVVVVGPERPHIAGARRGPLRFVSEEPPGSGPVPALRRGLAELDGSARGGWAEQATAAEPWVAVLAADLPFLRAAHLRALLIAAAGGDGAVLADDGGRLQWLAGCWRTKVLRRAATTYQGSSLHGLLAPLRPVIVSLPARPGEPPPWLDCDTEQDLRRAQRWAGMSGPPG